MSQPSDRAAEIVDRAELIEIAGPDAIAFAHAQFSSDVAGLAPASWQWSAWLNAQGRTRAVFVLARTGPDRLLAWLPLGGAATIRDALRRFVLRAKVRIEALENWAFGTLADAAAGFAARAAIVHRDGIALAQPGPAPRLAWLGPAADASVDVAALSAWRLAEVRAGLPWIADPTRDEFVPQALDLERLDAIRFDKGCFPGQEIAARLRYRGGLKQKLRRVALSGVAEAAPGLEIRSAQGRSGTLLYAARVAAAGHEALAVMGDASHEESETMQSAAGHRIEIIY